MGRIYNNIIIGFTLIILFIAVSCTKEKYRLDFSQGKASAFMNDRYWQGQGRGTENTSGIGFDMSYNVSNSQGFLRQSLIFVKIPKTPGTHFLHNTYSQTVDSLVGSIFITLSDDGDVIEDIYNILDDMMHSYLTVLSYDESTRWLKGSFDAMYYIRPNRPKVNEDNPDTLRFKSGEFQVRIE